MRIERNLSTDDGEVVVLYIDGPMASERESEYYCKIGIEGSIISETTIIYGIDQLQAVMLALRHLNSFIKKVSISVRPKRIFWELGADNDDFGLTF